MGNLIAWRAFSEYIEQLKREDVLGKVKSTRQELIVSCCQIVILFPETRFLTFSRFSLKPCLRSHAETLFFSPAKMAHHAQMSSGTLPSVQELFSLAGKTAIVTGGTGGLGLAMSIALAEAGADIVSIQISNDPRSDLLAEAMKELGRKLQVFETDVADSPKLRECFAKIWEAGVVPDILLNCAGINRRSQVENFTDEDIDAVSH